MPREPRIYIEKVLYFITAKSLDDRDLFQDPTDYTEYLKTLAELKREFGFKLFSYCLLPKRLFLLIELRNGVTISTIMHNLNSYYTKKYNSRYGKKGHLFQSRFKSILVEKEPFLLRLTRYIHLLPREVGIINNVASYPFSSYFTYTYEDHQGHTGMQWPNLIQEIKETLSQFHHAKTDKEQVEAYEDYMNGAGDKELEAIRKLLHRTAFVGSDRFKAMIRKTIEEHIVDDQKSKAKWKYSPWYAATVALVVFALSAATYLFYNNQSKLQETLNKTTDGFNIASNQLTSRVKTLQSELTKFEDTSDLDDTAWVIQITELNREGNDSVRIGKVNFNDGKVVIERMPGEGYPAVEYTLITERNGKTVWKTAQVMVDNTKLQIEGLWTGKSIKGLVRDRPTNGSNRDFTFTSVQKVLSTGRENNVIQ